MNTIVSQFNIQGNVVEVAPLGNGLINTTYRVKTEGDAPDYVLQHVNNAIFPDVDMLMNNIVAVTEHIHGKLVAAGTDDIARKVLKFVPAKDGKYYGAPTHVGAMVAFYDAALLESAGVDYTAIKTWDQWLEAGKTLKAAVPDAWMGTVETSTQWVASLMLAQQGKDVTIVEALDKIMKVNGPLCHSNLDMLEGLLPFNGVKILTSAKVAKFENGVLNVETAEGTKALNCDSVILAVGYNEENSLYHEVEFEVPEIYLLGDAKKVANIMYAIWDAFEVANHI